MAKIKVIIKQPDERYGHVTHISARLENLQKTVGGYIESIPVRPGMIIICNEEGKLQELQPNIRYHNDIIHGTIIVCGQSGEDICNIPISFDEWKIMIDCNMDDEIRFCSKCGWNDSDYGCTSPVGTEVYQCPMYMHYHPDKVAEFNKAMDEWIKESEGKNV